MRTIAVAMAAFFASEVVCRRSVGQQDPDVMPVSLHMAPFSFAQLRMQTWFHEGTTANEGSLVRHAGCPANASLVAGTEKYIFFERDRAGFNNIKLQLESMVAVAAITGRTLVLPHPGQNAHSSKYFEFDFFDAANLTGTIKVQLHKEPPKDALKVPKLLHDVNFNQLDKEKDWLFTEDNSRIQHFECLNLSDHDKAVAAHAVLHGVQFDRKFEKMANTSLAKLGLASENGEANFDCAHVRRGDFKSFASQYFLADDKLSSKLQSMLSGKRPVLVVSDEKPSLSLKPKVVYSSDAYDKTTSAQTKVALDMIMCSRAAEFVGSPLSTFSNGILELRRKSALLKGQEMPPTKLYAGTPDFQVEHGTCWNKQTTFAASSSCEKGAPACFSKCTGQM